MFLESTVGLILNLLIKLWIIAVIYFNIFIWEFLKHCLTQLLCHFYWSSEWDYMFILWKCRLYLVKEHINLFLLACLLNDVYCLISFILVYIINYLCVVAAGPFIYQINRVSLQKGIHHYNWLWNSQQVL